MMNLTVFFLEHSWQKDRLGASAQVICVPSYLQELRSILIILLSWVGGGGEGEATVLVFLALVPDRGTGKHVSGWIEMIPS